MRLIDADELIKAIEQGEGFSWDSHGKDDLCVRKKYIDNAPTVEQKEFEQVLQPIKVNIPKDITNKLIEEMSKPRKVILDESDPVKDCIIAYGDGFESARRLFERPHGKWVYKNDNFLIPTGYWECSVCEIGKQLVESNFCPNCGADMRGEAHD